LFDENVPKYVYYAKIIVKKNVLSFIITTDKQILQHNLEFFKADANTDMWKVHFSCLIVLPFPQDQVDNFLGHCELLDVE
jgi:ssRNA-specific RNase YbeY (16S rRNA maturation enzyme)